MKCDDGVGNLSAIYFKGFLGINKVEPRLLSSLYNKNSFCFLEEYYENYSDMFDLVYDFNEDNNEYENMARDNILLNKYLNDFKSNDSAIKLYDEIGIENVRKISLLAYLFCEYYYFIMDKFNELENDSNILIRIRN